MTIEMYKIRILIPVMFLGLICCLAGNDLLHATTSGNLVVIKNVDNEVDGFILNPSDFSITVSWSDGTDSTFNGEDGAGTSIPKPAGTTYEITVDEPTVELPSGVAVVRNIASDDDCEGTIVAGSTITCTITNQVRSVGTAETGTITQGALQAPTGTQISTIPTVQTGTAIPSANWTGYIKVVTNCIPDFNCKPFISPFVFDGERYQRWGTGFPGSEKGRIVEIGFFPGGRIQYQYDIVAESPYSGNISKSDLCEGTIKAGENKSCIININSQPLESAKVTVVSQTQCSNYTASECNQILTKPVRIQPFILNGNEYKQLGTGFPGSEKGRIVEIGDRPIIDLLQYNIFAESPGPLANITYSEDCEGLITAGENKTCHIRSTFYK